MKGKNFNNPGDKPRVLVAPLDWGLGHATRCIPIILMVLQQNCDVIIAAEGPCKFLLQEEFPDLVFLELKGYRITYSKNKSGLPLKILAQFPKLIYRIYAEHRWLNKMVKLHAIDLVISDNRFGMYHKTVPAVYITHQLKIKTGNRFTAQIAQKINYHFINKYKECWVPDTAGEINLAGGLSHPGVMPAVPVKYIGPLSRFKKIETENKYDLTIILSGPEPQRSVFEELILKDLKNYSGKTLLVRGLPANTTLLQSTSSSLEIQNHLPAAALNHVLQQSKIIISRCGYSTVMDLITLQKKAVLVPTPGQTEQEYLAYHLLKEQLFLCIDQNNFSLADVLKKAAGFQFKTITLLNDYEKTAEDFINSNS